MSHLPRWYLLVAIAAIPLASCREALTGPSSPPSLDRAKTAATFDWSMPARFGLDANNDGLIDYPRTPEEINPSSWTVNFDACQLPSATQYVWFVDNKQVAMEGSCKFDYAFPAEGVYDVALHLLGTTGPDQWAEQRVTVQDWLIVSFGDSYASGEGVPEIPQATDAVFTSITNALAGLAAAQQQLAAANQALQDALEEKGLAEQALTAAQGKLTQFINACDDVSFKGIAQCATFLEGLPYDTYQAASTFFNQAVSNAQARVASALQAIAAAEAAINSLNASIASAQSAIAQLKAGLQPARWQPGGTEDALAWGDNDCHRSANAAPARAARALESSDPHTSVTFVHLACSGAQVSQYPGRLEQQVAKARTLLGSREIDAVLLSIGGNDAGFARIATACALQQPCYITSPTIDPQAIAPVCGVLGLLGFGTQCQDFFNDGLPTESASTVLADGLSDLPTRYDEVANDLFPSLPGLLAPSPGPGAGGRGAPGQGTGLVRSDRVFITPYVDMTKDDSRAYCQLDLTDPFGSMPGMTPDEMQWLDLTAANNINQAVADAAAEHGWNLVTGIYASFEPHGYCAEAHWVNRILESLIFQGDYRGVAHPNNAGQSNDAALIVASLMPQLYPDGLTGASRAPDPAIVATPPGLMASRVSSQQ